MKVHLPHWPLLPLRRAKEVTHKKGAYHRVKACNECEWFETPNPQTNRGPLYSVKDICPLCGATLVFKVGRYIIRYVNGRFDGIEDIEWRGYPLRPGRTA